jgi:signal transduction histidine kinase
MTLESGPTISDIMDLRRVRFAKVAVDLSAFAARASMSWLERPDRVSRFTAAAIVVTITLIIAALDYASRTDASLSTLYIVPISVAAIAVGPLFSVFISCLSLLCWATSGALTDADDFAFSGFILWWNGAVLFAGNLVVIWALTSLRALQSNLEIRVRERAALLTREIAEREHLQGALLDFTEREQRRIGLDLGNSLCPHLSDAALAAQVLSEKLAARGSSEARDSVKLVELIEESIVLSRQIARGLHPVDMDEKGLTHALSQFAETASKLYRIDCRFSSIGTVLVEDRGAAEHLYRIAQEAVRNAVKHGGGKMIMIRLAAIAGRPSLTIEDDGTGFDSAVSGRLGMGLSIMAHRSRMVGAEFRVGSGEMGGTVVSVAPVLS